MGLWGTLLLTHRYGQHRMLHGLTHASASGGEASPLEYLIIPRAHLTQPGSSFTRIDEHEFIYREKLYDIVHEEWRGTDWHVWVLHDREEERYLEALALTLEPTLHAQPTRSTQRLPHVYQKPALVPATYRSATAVRSRTFPRFDPEKPQAPCLEVPHPPPWG